MLSDNLPMRPETFLEYFAASVSLVSMSVNDAVRHEDVSSRWDLDTIWRIKSELDRMQFDSLTLNRSDLHEPTLYEPLFAETISAFGMAIDRILERGGRSFLETFMLRTRGRQSAKNLFAMNKVPDKFALVDAVLFLREAIVRQQIIDEDSEANDSPFILRQRLPPQRLAPLKFEIIDDEIALQTQSHRPVDRQSARTARAEIIAKSKALIRELEQSNSDRRLLDCVTEFVDVLQAGKNIIKIGLNSLGVDQMHAKFAEELPDATNALFTTQSLSMNLYLSQFQEWVQFSERAVKLRIDEDAAIVIGKAVTAVISESVRRPAGVRNEVRDEFVHLQAALQSNPTSRKKVFASLSSIENFLSKALDLALRFADDVAQGVRRRAVDATALGVGGSLLWIIYEAGRHLGELAQMSELAWLRSALLYVKSVLGL